ncbi:MAG: hypothetical protein HXY53_07155 [Nitrospirae bacterium]|nr:hypothetical protein [Nitrospirota bacterium]
MHSVYPFEIKSWQSDNGSENLVDRTIQEEFIDNNLDVIHDKIIFNRIFRRRTLIIK